MLLRTALMMVLSQCCSASAQRIIFVRSAANGASNGTTWIDAYPDLQDALDDARTFGNCPCEIWVAAGMYKPDRGTGDRSMAFELDGDVALYGGFAGWEAGREQRDWRINETILSGDLAGDDDHDFVPTSGCCYDKFGPGCDDPVCLAAIAPAMEGTRTDCAEFWGTGCDYFAQMVCCDLCRPSRCENSIQVIRVADGPMPAVIDGFTISGGEANDGPNADCGGAILASLRWLHLSNCRLTHNAGTPICAKDAVLNNLEVVENYGYSGGPIVFLSSFAGPGEVHGCSFRENHGRALSGWDLLVENSYFFRNEGGGASFPGAVLATNAAVIHRTVFEENVPGSLRAGVAVVTDSVFTRTYPKTSLSSRMVQPR